MSSFPTTRWSEIVAAGLGGDAGEAAMTRFLHAYTPVMQRFLTRGAKLPACLAEETVQDFIADKVFLGQLLTRADQKRGRFRAFLCKCLSHYVVSSHRQRARQDPQRLSREEWKIIRPQCGDKDNPERVFDVEWARHLLKMALSRMETECRATGKAMVWAVFDDRLLNPLLHGKQATPYDLLSRQLKLKNAVSARERLYEAKKIFKRTLKSVVSEYTATKQEVDEELNELKIILGQNSHNA